MKVTPLDIRRKEFKRSMRGYSDEEVDVFLDDVADEFERLFQENMELQDRMQRMEEQIAGHTQLKNALEKTLVSAQLQADQMIANARKEGELVLKDAELKARHIVNDSYSETQKVQQSLIQLKHLEEDFRFKFRSLLEGHLKLLGDVPIAAPQAVEAGAVPAATVIAAADTGATDAAAADISDAAVQEESDRTPLETADPAGPVSESQGDEIPAVTSALATVAPEAAAVEEVAREDTITEETDFVEVLVDDHSFESPADYAVDPDKPLGQVLGDDADLGAGTASIDKVASSPDSSSIAGESTVEVEVTEVEGEQVESSPEESPVEESEGFFFGRRMEIDDDGFFTEGAPVKDKSRDFEW